MDGGKVPFQSCTITAASLRDTGRVRLNIKALPSSTIAQVELGLKDALGAPLTKGRFPEYGDLVKLSDAIDLTLRSMSLHGKIPKRFDALSKSAIEASFGATVEAVIEEPDDFLG